MCQCCRAPLAHTEIKTFLVTPGAARGRHLYNDKLMTERLPDLSNGHGLLHVVVEDVTCLPSESVEDSDCAITMSSSDIFVIGVESDTESLF